MTGQRYLNHEAQGTHVLLFARESPSDDLGVMPFLCPGTATHIEHRGERPIAITWRLNRSMPGRFSTRLRWLHAEGGPWARRMVTSPLVPRPWHARSVNRGEASCWLCEAAARASTGELAFVLPLDGSMADGHRLVVSRRHAADWWALTDGERQAVLDLLDQVREDNQVQEAYGFSSSPETIWGTPTSG